ncbi:hypothetical protein ABIF63_004829 [Bradyrhizobium japonicum]|uniref:DUF6456 domain-containing protein n=1 Tax=Bradyrhizobium japonicum TaxID=375 RepID=A0ABV2RUW8_BRAJP|nr:DUF6456 domain-containing protein [Bradyrhizobium japonicum]WLB16191.1 DUF6456 domain-containing protein [Bradyrhizobium japonicum]
MLARVTDVAPVYVDKERDRRARGFARELRRARVKDEYRGRSVASQLAYEAEREHKRQIQECIVDWMMDYKTPRAERVAEWLKREKLYLQGFQKATAKAGDPLNLLGKPLTKKQLKEIAEEERLASGKRKHVIPDPDHPMQNVLVDTAASAHINLVDRKKLNDPEEKMRRSAADRFRRDFDLSSFHGSKGFALGDKVDGGGGGSASHTIALEAQSRLNEIKRRIGDRQFDILRARIGCDASAEDMHKHGGPDHRSSNIELKVALNALVEVYDHVTIVDRTWNAARRILEAVGMGMKR